MNWEKKQLQRERDLEYIKSFTNTISLMSLMGTPKYSKYSKFIEQRVKELIDEKFGRKEVPVEHPWDEIIEMIDK